MDFEDLQKAWQSQKAPATVTIDVDLLLKEVRRNHDQFWATIFWRDVREVAVAFLLTAYFVHNGLRHHFWTDIVAGLCCFGVGLFMIIDNLIQMARRPITNDSLKSCLESSLHQVNHQIWLLSHIFWWYLLPLLLGILIAISPDLGWALHHGAAKMIHWGLYLVVVAFINWGVYWLNQTAVQKSLLPRRKELEALLANLS